MNGRQKTALLLSCVALIVMLLFPPYFAMDGSSQGRIHAPVGYHPAWAPPSQAYVHRAFVVRGLIPETGGDPAALDVRRNTVRLGFNISGLVLLTLVGVIGLKSRTPRRPAAM